MTSKVIPGSMSGQRPMSKKSNGRKYSAKRHVDNSLQSQHYMQETAKKRALRNRLYDSGISNFPLPSVERPIEEKLANRPFSAKMSKKTVQNMSPKTKEIQDANNSMIQFMNMDKGRAMQVPLTQGSMPQNLNMSDIPYQDPGMSSFIDPGDVSVDQPGEMSQVPMNIYDGGQQYNAYGQQYSTNQPLTQGSKQGSGMTLSRIGENKYSYLSNSITGLTTMTALRPSVSQNSKKRRHLGFFQAKISQSRPRIGNDFKLISQQKQGRRGKLREIMMQQSAQEQMQKSETMFRDPSLFQFQDQSTFSQKTLERARSKFLLSKLRGKEPQVMEGPNGARSTKGFSRLGGSSAKFIDTENNLAQVDETSVSESKYNDSQFQAIEKPVVETGSKSRKDNQSELDRLRQKPKKHWNELDKYIELLLDSKQTDESVFVYLVQNDENNPYDLKVCAYQERKENKYYTLSSKGITLYNQDGPQEFIQLGDWLIERDSYNHIKELSFFKKFKRWKFLRMWRKNILNHNRIKHSNSLQEKLFLLHPIFRDSLFRHRQHCIDMMKLRFIYLMTSASNNNTMGSDECQTLDNFMIDQKKQRDFVNEEIRGFSNKCRVNFKNAITSVLNELRDRIVSELAMEEEQKKTANTRQGAPNTTQTQSNEPNFKSKKNNTVLEGLGFPDDMTYGHRSTLRKECSRFLRFAYLVDFLAMESLTGIYMGSVNDLLKTLYELDSNFSEEDLKKVYYQNQGFDPIFQVQITFDPKVEIDADDILKEEVIDFKLPPHGNSEPQDFDMTCHLELEEEVNPEDEDSQSGYDSFEAEIPKVYQYKAINLFKYWLYISPTSQELGNKLLQCFSDGLESIGVFERWSKHEDLTPYASALEEWDDMVGGDWEEPESNFLTPTPWINEEELFQTREVKLRTVIKSAYQKAESFLASLQSYLYLYWNHTRIDFTLLTNERLKAPTDMLLYSWQLFKLQEEDFENIPDITTRGILQIENSSCKDMLLPSPKDCLNKINEIVPEAIKRRTEVQKKWLNRSIEMMQKRVANVEEYVEQNNNLNYVQNNFQEVRDKIQLYGMYYDMFSEHGIGFKKEDKDNHSDSITDIQKLSALIMDVEGAQDSNLKTFQNTLEDLIPKLNEEIDKLAVDVDNDEFLSNKTGLYEVLGKLDNLEQRCKQMKETSEKYNNYQEVLQVQATHFDNLDDTKEQLELRCLMWRSLREWEESTEIWVNQQFDQIDAKKIAAKCDEFTVKCIRLNKNLPDNPISHKLSEMVDQFKLTVPVVVSLRNEFLREHHWKEIKELIGTDFDVTEEDFTLNSLLLLNAQQFQEEIQGISAQASAEASLQKQLDLVEDTWKKIDFITKIYKDRGKDSAYILDDLDDIYQSLDETLAIVNTVLGSRYVRPLRVPAEEWKKNLVYLSKVLDNWIALQKQWMYLENIFTAQDIRKQLASESSKFDMVDKFFTQLMYKTTKKSNVIMTIKTGMPTLNDNLIQNNTSLDEIQKSLENYLELKRSAFPRFYFLSNDELLEILAKSNDLDIIQQHLRTCFDNIQKLEIDDIDVTHMLSGEGEKVKLQKAIKARGQVETWMGQIQTVMIDTLQKAMKLGLTDYEVVPERHQWALQHIGQVVATISHVLWCTQTEMNIEEMVSNPAALEDWFAINEQQLQALTELVRGKLTSLQRKIIVGLVTQDVHARDIVETLNKNEVSSINDFNWVQQLRYYWNDEQDICVIKQINARFNYGYEYMGATSRLVITPLTDRCWITITGALHIKLGAAPAGPAGTGKTESTKDLAKALGIQCVVFNCSDQITYQMMGRLFSGLAQQGAWTCLDEFNRIEIEVLSVIAQQLLTIRIALLDEVEVFLFEEQTIPLKPTCGVFITMNPGYAGRTELPDNLKVLFRPVSMMIPDYRLIAEIMLFAEGFGDAKSLSMKMVKLYKLSSEQLSQQDHYDFGMRAVKSVLVMAGALKRSQPDIEEGIVLIRAMRDSNIPKFVSEDLPLFSALIQDLFPDASIPAVDFAELEDQIEESILKLGYQVVPEFKTKVVQLFDTFDVRFGVMIVGPTGGGKTTCYEMLQEAMTTLRVVKNSEDIRYQKVETSVVNPKSITMGELYGEVNVISQEWRDGLASKIMREAALHTNEDKTWVVFDGPVDALWIENMNTVLDDNMTLCLANGQRIKLRTPMRMLFEVQDLAVASPATVSRCGMVYMTPEDLGWRPYVQSWIPRVYPDETLIDAEFKQILIDLFEAAIDPAISKIRDNGLVEYIKTVDLQLVVSVCNFLEVLFTEQYGFKGSMDDKKKSVAYYFAFAYIWGMGASLDSDGRDRFDDVVKDSLKGVSIPMNGTCFDYYLDVKKEAQFKAWKIPEFEYVKDSSYFSLLVPTIDTYRHGQCLEMLLDQQKEVFFTGVTGVGKSVIIMNLLNKIQESRSLNIVNLNFSAQTSSLRTQQSIEEKIEKKVRRTYGAPPGKKLVFFVDDVNMPSVEEFGAQPPIELLRLFVERRGLYDRDDLLWKEVEDYTVICAAARPGGGRNEITPRLSRHFNIFNVPEASRIILQKIFGSILDGFLSNGFYEPIVKMSESIILGTIEIYYKIIEEKLPTPACFHYLFNLRDVSKVFQGILMTKPKSIGTPEILGRLWMHECCRVFHDRLICKEDKQWFTELVADQCNNLLRVRIDHDEQFVNGTLLFGDLLKLDSNQHYEEMREIGKVKKQLEDSLDIYNASVTSKMNLVFFQDAIENVVRISRVLRQPRGSQMLIGVGGSGKQCLTRLSCFMRSFIPKQIELTKNFGSSQFRDFLKELMFETGIDGNNLCFLITDTQIVNESFLEDINNLLNTGNVPNLFEPDEIDKIINDVRPIVVKMKIPDTIDTVLQIFTDRVRENLHICLCMSPVGDVLRIRCRMFPSLVNCCTLNWFDRWPEEALLYVSSEFLKEVELPSEEVTKGLAEMCMKIHTSVETYSQDFYDELRRKIYTTPKSYLDLIELYTTSLEAKRKEYNENKFRLATGLKKLVDTNENIAVFKVKIEELQPLLKTKSEEIAIVLKQVEADRIVANEKERITSDEAEIVDKQAQEAQVIAEEAERELKLAEPELLKAQEAAKSLDKPSIVEIKSFPKPPPAVKTVMEAVMILLGQKVDWPNVKLQLNDTGAFMTKLQAYDVEKCSEEVFTKIYSKFVSKPDFDPVQVGKSSQAAGSMCLWVRALYSYSRVLLKVAPLKKRYAEEKAKLDSAQAALKQKMDDVKEIKDKVAELEKSCQETQEEKQRLEDESEQCQQRMRRAEKLLVLLEDEGVRWGETVEKIDGEIQKLVGNVFLSSGCISYYGAFTGVYRQQMVKQWVEQSKERNIPISDEFSLIKIMGDPVVIREWNQHGLPTDNVSVQNGIMATQAKRWPLLIDPQQQANKWIKSMEKENNLEIIKQGIPTLLRTMGLACSAGRPIIIEDVEEFIDPGLDSVLQKQQYKTEGGLLQIKIGDQTYDYDEFFRFYMTTKMPNPHYLPEVFIKMTIINFTVTFKGLEDQMLGDVVVQEKPEVEQQRDEIIVSMDNDNKTLKKIENEILKLLSESTEEQILDEDNLIIVLEDSKKTSADIKERIEESKKVEAEIDETRNLYRDVAIRGSILYFVIADLAGIDPMYQYSLGYVKKLFNKAMQMSPEQESLLKRIEVLIDNITKTLYKNVSRGLFAAHKLIFSFLITTSINRNAGVIDSSTWSTLLRGAGTFDETKIPDNPLPHMIKEISWNLCYYLEISMPERFEGLCQHVTDNIEVWEDYATLDEPQEEKLPEPWESKLSTFEKIVILKIWRPEKLLFAFTNYVREQLGVYFIESGSVSMEVLYEESDKKTPVIFVLSQGADPTSQLTKFAKEMKMEDKLTIVSLGQGQGKKAEKHIDISKSKKDGGGWVLLQNCHLAKSWMPDLEVIVEMFAENYDLISDNFRLFLTSMPAPYFPVSVLQNGVKLTTEPPRGMKANLQRSFKEQFNEENFEQCKQLDVWKKIVFGLCFFHSTVQERRKFGPLGWNKSYEFNDSDLETSITMLRMFLDEQEEIPWDAMVYVTGHINYGGRVTDDWDRVCLLSILKKFYTTDILEDGYKFSASGIYFAPPTGSLESYRQYINTLPIIEAPEIFGMHQNANITFQNQESTQIVNTVLSIQPRVALVGGGKTSDEIVVEMCQQFEKDLPEPLDRKNGLKEMFKPMPSGQIQSLTTVLIQEMQRFNKLLVVMKFSLENLQKAIKGLIVMDGELDAMNGAMLNGRVPDNWELVAYPSLKPLTSWFKDLVERVEFMDHWLKTGHPNTFWLSGFFFPQGFMTGVLQTHSRKHRTPIDILNFSFTILDDDEDQVDDYPEDGVYIYGLFTDGCRWDREERCLADQYPGEMYSVMPVIHFNPIENYEPNPDEYSCPIYKTSERAGVLTTTGQSSNFINAVELTSNEPPTYSTLNGAALLCQLNY